MPDWVIGVTANIDAIVVTRIRILSSVCFKITQTNQNDWNTTWIENGSWWIRVVVTRTWPLFCRRTVLKNAPRRLSSNGECHTICAKAEPPLSERPRTFLQTQLREVYRIARLHEPTGDCESEPRVTQGRILMTGNGLVTARLATGLESCLRTNDTEGKK
ncbi:hypothetical protein Cantr_01162 [Candida viswanathii]|uniref:Uncharacterized protein n=1 Tax=Candida viswanathii TaxID=5486 RepID=A0A367YKS0_9ASCO|nr:hypothetical protein Cantr_01162 [Candida viswanathii]